MAYALTHSGDKTISPFLTKLLGTDETLTTAKEQTIGTMLDEMLGDNWQRKYDALMEEYNPIENYSMTETGTDRNVGSGTNSTTYGAGTKTDNLGATESNTLEKTYGFNSEGASNKGSVTTNGNAVTNTETTAERTDSGSATSENQLTHSLSRSGNIGTTTTQQMLQSELELRNYNFYAQVFMDIDKYLALAIYD